MANRYFICPESQNLHEGHIPPWQYCGNGNKQGWVQPTPAELAEILELDIQVSSPAVIAELLDSIAAFDTSVSAQLIGYYLAIFIVGFSVGTVIRIMKKA